MLEITYNSKNGHISKIRFNEVSISDLDEALINFMDEVAENTDKWY